MTMRASREFAVSLSVVVVGFVAWWIRELRSFLPAGWRSGSEAHIEASVGERGIRIALTGSGRVEPIDIQLEPEVPGASLPQAIAALPVWLIPPSDAVLSRVVRVPRSAASRFDALLQVEADRWTSFSVDEMIYGCGPPKVIDDNRSEIELRFVARSTASSWVKALEAHGLSPSWVILGAAQQFKVRWQRAPQRRRLGMRKLLIGATAAAAVLAIGADWIAARREQGVWQQRVAALRTHLGRQRELETRIASLRATHGAVDSRQAQPRSMQFAALAEALPPSDWLTELSIREEMLTLRGYSKNVEVLLKALEPLARDRIVTVQGELALDTRLERQRFTVTLRTKGAGS